MYRVDRSVKADPVQRWNLSDRVFFACGACHILTYRFLKRHAPAGFSARWIKRADGFRGNHIVATDGNMAFDYHGYTHWPVLLAHTMRKAQRWWPGWSCTVIDLPVDALISTARSRRFHGLWLREPQDFLKDPLLRAERFIERFQALGKSA